MQNKATNGSLRLKRRVLKGRRPSGKRCRPLPNLWHEWNKWMKENENGWGVISGRQCETIANYYEWETAAELVKKKGRKNSLFFIHHPRIINRAQAFWWGWRKPQDTWLTSHHRGGRWNAERGKKKKKRGLLLGNEVEFLVTVSYKKSAGKTKSGAKTENCQEAFLEKGNKKLKVKCYRVLRIHWLQITSYLKPLHSILQICT